MKTYYVKFSSGDPRSNTGLAPTFLTFNTYGTAVTPPGITSVIGATGFYAFQWGTTTPIVFLIDGATSGLTDANRYITGSIDPDDRSDEYGTTIVAIGTSLIALGSSNIALGTTGVALGTSVMAISTTLSAIGTTLNAIGLTNSAIGLTVSALVTGMDAKIGSTLSSFGTTSVDPGDLFGYLKRAQEFREGDQTFSKTSGQWDISTRGGTLLISKTLQNSSSTVTKS